MTMKKIKMLALLGRYLIELSWKSFPNSDSQFGFDLKNVFKQLLLKCS